MAENKGNPYHDADGRFTSRENAGSGARGVVSDAEGWEAEELMGAEPKAKALKIKAGADIAAILAQKKAEIEAQRPKDAAYFASKANEEMRKITGIDADVVSYDKSTTPENAESLNSALKEMIGEFPELFRMGGLISYGTGRMINTDVEKTMAEKAINASKRLYGSAQYRRMLESAGYNDDQIERMRIASSFVIKTSMDGVETSAMEMFRGMRCGGFYQQAGFGKSRIPNQSMQGDVFANVRINHKLMAPGGLRFFHVEKHSADKGKAYYIAAHELGHHVSLSLAQMMNVQEYYDMRKSLYRDGDGKMTTIQDLYRNGEITVYAANADMSEHIAEAFADVMSNGESATAHNKNVYGEFKKYYDKVFGAVKTE